MNQQEASYTQHVDSAQYLNTWLQNPPGIYQIEKVWGWIKAVIVTLGCATWAGSYKAVRWICTGGSLCHDVKSPSLNAQKYEA